MSNETIDSVAFLSLFAACSSSNNNKPASPEEREIAEMNANIKIAWNNKDMLTYSSFWYKDLQMIIADIKTRKNIVVDFDTFMAMLPERMEKIGKIRFRASKILESRCHSYSLSNQRQTSLS